MSWASARLLSALAASLLLCCTVLVTCEWTCEGIMSSTERTFEEENWRQGSNIGCHCNDYYFRIIRLHEPVHVFFLPKRHTISQLPSSLTFTNYHVAAKMLISHGAVALVWAICIIALGYAGVAGMCSTGAFVKICTTIKQRNSTCSVTI